MPGVPRGLRALFFMSVFIKGDNAFWRYGNSEPPFCKCDGRARRAHTEGALSCTMGKVTRKKSREFLVKITDLLRTDGIVVGSDAATQTEAIDQLVTLQAASGGVQSAETFREAILTREAAFSTAIGDGIALPHASSPSVRHMSITVMSLAHGVDWSDPNNSDVDLVFMLAAPDDDSIAHLHLLSKITTMLMDPSIVRALRNATTPDEFIDVIAQAEARAAASRNVLPEDVPQKRLAKHAKNIVEDAPEPKRQPKHRRWPIMPQKIKVDTSANDVMDEAETTNALDETQLEPAATTSFLPDDTRELMETHLAEGLVRVLPYIAAGGVLTLLAFALDWAGLGTAAFGFFSPHAAFFKKVGEEALGMLLPVLAGYIAFSIADRPGLAPGIVGGLLVRNGYTIAYLQSAPRLDVSLNVSAGFIAAIGIGFAAGYLMRLIMRLCDKLPDQLEGIKPILLYPLLGILGTGAIYIAVSPLFSLLRMGLDLFFANMGGTNAIILGALLGGLMAVDLGGIFNSAAYAFGTALLASQTLSGQQAMASIMVGGMVPPLVIAISSTILARNKWGRSERYFGGINYVLGLSFISDGTIPYAATDLARVTSSCVLGALVAGGLCGCFGCATTTPAGGIFALPTITNPALFVLSLLVGSVLGALVLSFLRKPRTPA